MPTNCLGVLDHFVGFVLKGLIMFCCGIGESPVSKGKFYCFQYIFITEGFRSWMFKGLTFLVPFLVIGYVSVNYFRFSFLWDFGLVM